MQRLDNLEHRFGHAVTFTAPFKHENALLRPGQLRLDAISFVEEALSDVEEENTVRAEGVAAVATL
jgi:hypothetical protein